MIARLRAEGIRVAWRKEIAMVPYRKELCLDPFNLDADRIKGSKIRCAMVGGFLSEDGRTYESKFFGASYWSGLRDDIFRLVRDIDKRRISKTGILSPYENGSAYYCCRYIINAAKDFRLALVISIYWGDDWQPRETAHIVLPWH